MLWLTGLYFYSYEWGEMAIVSYRALSMVTRLTPVRFASFNDGCLVLSFELQRQS